MSLTLLDAVLHLPTLSTEYRTDKLEQENGYITLITDVSTGLSPHNDFDFNGHIVESLPRADFISKYGDVKLNELNDFRVKNIKLMWSPAAIQASDEGAIFLPSLTIRLLEVNDTEELIHYVSLRNKYGSSLTTLSWQKPKK